MLRGYVFVSINAFARKNVAELTDRPELPFQLAYVLCCQTMDYLGRRIPIVAMMVLGGAFALAVNLIAPGTAHAGNKMVCKSLICI